MIALASLIGVILIIAWVAAVINTLAQKQKFFVEGRQGQILVVEKGRKLHKFITIIEGWNHLGGNGPYRYRIYPVGSIVDEATGKNLTGTAPVVVGRLVEPRQTGILEDAVGIVWIGIYSFYKIKTWEFSWDKFAKKTNSTLYEIVSREGSIEGGRVDSIYWEYPYAARVPEIETRTPIPPPPPGTDEAKTPPEPQLPKVGPKITVDLQITTRSIDPEKMMYKANTKWLDQLMGLVHSRTRDYVGSKTYDEMVAEQKEGGNSPFVKLIFDLNERAGENPNDKDNNPSLYDLIGVEIINVNFMGLKLIARPEMEAATEAVYIAGQEATAQNLRTDAERRNEEEVRKGIAAGWNAYLEVLGKLDPGVAAALVTGEAIQRTNVEALSMGGEGHRHQVTTADVSGRRQPQQPQQQSAAPINITPQKPRQVPPQKKTQQQQGQGKKKKKNKQNNQPKS